MWIIALAALNGFIAVATGAMSDHVLAARLEISALESIERGLHYQFVHTGALLALGILQIARTGWPLLNINACLFLAGNLCFFGGILLYRLTEIQPVAYLVPVGGSSYLLGWLLLFIAALKFRKTHTHD